MPLASVADGTMDGRTSQGLKRSATRKLSSKDAAVRAEGHLLNNFAKAVVAAEAVAPKVFWALPESELKSVLGLLVAEGMEFPASLKYNLVARRAQQLVTEKQFSKLLSVCSPWELKEWCPYSPCLGGLGTNEVGRKMSLWRKLVFNDLLAPLVLEGEAQRAQVVAICNECLDMTRSMDMVECENMVAQLYDEASCAWRALVALSTDSLDPAYEAALS